MKLGRNDPCSCGSGKKFKNCCLGKAGPDSPASAPVETSQLDALFSSGQFAELESRALLLVKQQPNAGYVWKLLGLSLHMQGKDALAALKKAAALLPNDAEAHGNLAALLRARGQLEEAVTSARRAVQIRPDFAAGHNNLGVILQDTGRLDETMASYRRALEINPRFAEAHNNLGGAYLKLGQIESALDSFRRALELKPDFAEAHNNLGNALKELGRLDQATASYLRALELKPEYAEACNNLGIVLKKRGQLEDAMDSYSRALKLKPEYAEAHNNLGIVLRELGRLGEALAGFRRALELKHDYIDAYDNLLLSLNFTDLTPEYRLEEARKYGRMVSKKVTTRYSAWECAVQPQRLRVGMVSGDLHKHPVGYFLEGLLSQIDPARIELIAYPTGLEEDELTARIRPHFSAWKPLFGKSDAAAAQLIHADGVHVLLDLTGHAGHNRLPVFAWKPAPVQAAWLGYFATTGVAEMDYLFADKVGVPEAQRGHFCERVWYLPDTRLCYTAPEFNLPVAALPAMENGYITFGCFQNLAKLGDAVLETWGKIFAALPDARLRMQRRQLGKPAQVEQLNQRLLRHGINPDRVTTHGEFDRERYLSVHAEVDFILDTFPYPGGTTTCDALWMGVPTLTLTGDTLLARQGASLLTAAGLDEWVATNQEEYIAKAISFAGNLTRLAALRAGLRHQVQASPLFDAPRFARNFEDALWGMWQSA